MQFPEDETGQLLKSMHEQGVDLTQSHSVDFFVLFEKQPQAEQYAQDIRDDVLKPTVRVEKCSDTGVWECRVTLQMKLEHFEIEKAELYLESTADQYNGYGDGWGVMAEE